MQLSDHTLSTGAKSPMELGGYVRLLARIVLMTRTSSDDAARDASLAAFRSRACKAGVIGLM